MEKGYEIKCLDHGFVRYVDHMGTDERICEAARISYRSPSKGPEADQKLINYLYRNIHSSPFEMVKITFNIKMPVFVARQYTRHRMQCLASETILDFDLPTPGKRGTTRHYKLTIKNVYDKWQSNYKKNRIKKMRLRSIDENTHKLKYTNIVNCVSSGEKQLYKVVIKGASIRASADHKFLTSKGWKKLAELHVGDKIYHLAPLYKRVERIEPTYTPTELDNEIWKKIVGFGDLYEVSNLGRVRSWQNTRNVKQQEPKVKLQTTTCSGHKCLSLSKKGKSKRYFVHKLVLDTFVGLKKDNFECLHKDGNGFNNKLENLQWGTKQQNQKEKTEAGSVPSLSVIEKEIIEITKDVIDETYDIEVDGPWHNFSANNIIVHNSMNEVSARYTKLPNEFYIPEKWRLQDTVNKQGSSVEEYEYNLPRSQELARICNSCYDQYEFMLQEGIAREMARMVLPVNIYTEIYCCWDLKNLLHFITLRDDGHAQSEIQDYGKAVKAIATELFPMTLSAYEKYKWKLDEFPTP